MSNNKEIIYRFSSRINTEGAKLPGAFAVNAEKSKEFGDLYENGNIGISPGGQSY